MAALSESGNWLRLLPHAYSLALGPTLIPNNDLLEETFHSCNPKPNNKIGKSHESF